GDEAPHLRQFLAAGSHHRLRAYVHRSARGIPRVPGARSRVPSGFRRRPCCSARARRAAAVGHYKAMDVGRGGAGVRVIDPVLTSKQRWTIVGLLSASITINLLDRQVLSVLASELRTQFHWSNAQYGYIAVAFNVGMMCGQIPVGALMDRVGTRIGLTMIFLAWSTLSLAHGLAGPGTPIEAIATALISWIPGLPALAAGLAGFLLLRFLMGLSQCGNYTAGIKALAGLFPAETRARAGGVFNAGAQFGSVIAPPIVVFLASRFGWRMGFVVPAIVSLVWLIPWLATFPDKETMATAALKPAAARPALPEMTAALSLARLF